MKNTLKLPLICLLFTSCLVKKYSEFKVTKSEKLTFIFDFDATMYNFNKDSAYFNQIYYSIVNGDEKKMTEYHIFVKDLMKTQKEHDVIENGQIVEDGSFQDLLAKNDGRFKKMWDSQINGMVV